MRMPKGGAMTAHKLMGIVAMVLCACAPLVAGCGSSGAVTSTTGGGGATGVSGLYRVSVDGKWGYIDKTGAIKIRPQFDVAHDFSDGLATVLVVEGDVQKWGYIDTSGTVVIQPQFDQAFDFSEGLAAVVIGSSEDEDLRCGFIDKTGRVVIPMQYEYPAAPATWKFSEGLCAVMVEEAGQQLWGFIDKTGTMVIKAQFATALDFSEGLAAAASSNFDLHGFIDKTGNWVIQLPPDLVLGGFPEGFSEGLAIVLGLVVQDAEALPRPLQGYIDKTGTPVIKPQFDWASNFSEGLAAVGIKENDVTKWGYIDKTGTWVIEPQYDSAGFFSEGLAPVGVSETHDPGSVTDDRWSYIDETGKVVITLQQGQVPREFSGGIAQVDGYTDVTKGPDSMAHIDTSGKVIWPGK
jgi:WG containing repeat